MTVALSWVLILFGWQRALRAGATTTPAAANQLHEQQEVLSTADAARQLRVGDAAVLRLAWTGWVPHLRPGHGQSFSHLQHRAAFRGWALVNVHDDGAADC